MTDKDEAHRLYKRLKAGMVTFEELNRREIKLLERYYPRLRKILSYFR